MEKLVLAYIRKLHMFEQNDRVVVGLSGGADSVCLLYLLHRLQDELGIVTQAVHVHHGLRPEADDEAEFAKNLCEQWNIPFRTEKIDVTGFQEENRLGTEEAARILRYEIFEKEIQKGAKIALAHHKNDQAETVLFHLFRGSSLRGLCGIQPIRGEIVRPLLCVTREEIEKYLKEHGIPYVTDQSNFDTVYARNLIRCEILPIAEEKLFHNATEHICAGADSIRSALDFLDDEVQKQYEQHVVSDKTGCRIYKKVLRAMHPYMRSEIVFRMLTETCGRKKDISGVHVEAVLELLELQSGRCRKLIYHTWAHTDQHCLFIQKEEFPDQTGKNRDDDTEETAEIFPDIRQKKIEAELGIDRKTDKRDHTDIGGDVINFGNYRVTFRIFPYNKKEDIPCGNYTKWFDYDKIEADITSGTAVSVRYRRSGDFFYCAGDSRKKVQDYMVDAKIPASERNRIPLVAVGSHALWMVGYRISEYFKVTDETKYILEIAAEKGE